MNAGRRSVWAEALEGAVLANADDQGIAYSLGYVFGILVVIGIPVALIVWGITRRSNRNAPVYRPSPGARIAGPAPDAVWDGTRWLRWDGTRWHAWDGAAWRFWDGTQWISPAPAPAPAPPPFGAPISPPHPPPE